jgi:hypothetical protein
LDEALHEDEHGDHRRDDENDRPEILAHVGFLVAFGLF